MHSFELPFRDDYPLVSSGLQREHRLLRVLREEAWVDVEVDVAFNGGDIYLEILRIFGSNVFVDPGPSNGDVVRLIINEYHLHSE